MITDQRPPRDDFAEMRVFTCTSSWPPEEEERLEMLRQVRKTAEMVGTLYFMAWTGLVGTALFLLVSAVIKALEVFK